MFITTVGTLRRVIGRYLTENSSLYSIVGTSYGWLDTSGRMHELDGLMHTTWADEHVTEFFPGFSGDANLHFFEMGWVAMANALVMTAMSGLDEMTDAQHEAIAKICVKGAQKKYLTPEHDVYVGRIFPAGTNKMKFGDFVFKIGGRQAEDAFFAAL